MAIYQKIMDTYPELIGADLLKLGITLQDDLDAKGIYIVEWNYSKPIPEGLKIGK